MSGMGHLAPALIVKAAAPAVPLWALLVASETNDLLYFLFTTTGVEKKVEMTMDFQRGVQYLTAGSNPWSHGLLMSVIWSVIAAGIGLVWLRNSKAAGLLGLVVLSHWLLDFLMHANLPLAFDGSPLVGLGLENTGIGFIFMTVLDLALLVSGTAMFWSSHKRAAQRVQKG